MKRYLILYLIVLIISACSSDPGTDEIPTLVAVAETNSCETIVETALASLDTICSDVGRNRACYINRRIDATLRDIPAESFDEPGELIDIDSLETMSLSRFDPDLPEWGFAVLKMQANIPDTLPGQNVTFLLFGGTEITPQGTVDGLQAFYVRTGIGATYPCNAVPEDGFLVQTPDNDITVNFSLNGIDFELGSTAYIQAEPDAEMIINLIEGQAVVSAQGASQTIPAGSRTRVSLDANGIADAPPTAPEPYSVDTTRNLPISALERTIIPADPVTIAQGFATLSTLSNPTAGVQSGELLTAGEEHIIELNLTAGQIIFFDGERNSNDNIFYTLIAPDGTEIRSWRVDSENRRFDIEESGNYSIRVYGRDDAIGAYNFNLWDVPQDSSETATLSAGSSTTISGQLDIPGVYLFYDVDLSAGQIVFFDGDPVGDDPIRYKLFAPDGTELRSWRVGTENRRYEIEQSGTYRFQILGADDAVGTYSFTLWDVPQNSSETATLSARASTTISGELDIPGVYQFYDIDLSAGQIVFFDGDETGDDAIWYTLFAPDGSEIRVWRIDFDNRRYEIEQTGTYRFQIQGNDGAIGAYSFTLWNVPQDNISTVRLGSVPLDLSGELSVVGAYDIYEVALVAGQSIQVSGDRETEGAIWYRLIAPDESEVRTGRINREDRVIDIEVSGIYRILILANDDSVGSYTLQVSGG